MAALLALGLYGASAGALRAEDVGAPVQPRPRPAWLTDAPLVFVGNWDSMPPFTTRRGWNLEGQEEEYAWEHTDEAVRAWKDMGATMALIHFYKGFGLEAEREHIADARALAERCRRHGLRVGVYVGSTIGYETFLVEKPEAEAWLVPDFLGRPVVYGNQYFRRRVYFMHPGFRDYMKRVLELAVKDLRVDLVHFDNTSMRAEPPIFHHPMAVEDFRDFLRTRHPPEALKRRLGFDDVRHVRPPALEAPPRVLSDPLLQEWTDFRCRQLADFYGEMAAYIRGLNPEVAVVCNPHTGLSGRNTMWEQGVDYPRLLAHTDAVWSEEGDEAEVTGDGILVSKIRTYKMARRLGNRIFTYTADSPLQLAEAMAYNGSCLGMVSGSAATFGLDPVWSGWRIPEHQRRYVDFFVRHFERYQGTEPVADVAVLRSYASLAYNNDRPWQSVTLFEQALIQARVPFDIIFDVHLGELSRYRVLVLADQECLGEEAMERVRAFVRGGGGLVATEHTSLYTEWRRRRKEFGLKDLLGIETPSPVNPGAPERGVEAEPVRREVERGRVAYLPEVKPAAPKPAAAAMTSAYWKLPLNAAELVEAVRWAAGGTLAMEVEAPPTVTAELVEQAHTGSWILHLVRFDGERAPALEKIGVRLRPPAGKRAGEVLILSPDAEGPPTAVAAAVEPDGRQTFMVPRLRTYAMAVIRWRP